MNRATKEVVWEYVDDPPQNFFSPYMSSGQRLPNGNTLITEASFGRIFEVTLLAVLAVIGTERLGRPLTDDEKRRFVALLREHDYPTMG